MTHLGKNFLKISDLAKVGDLSEAMITSLLEEKKLCENQTILRLKTFVTWLSVNSMEDKRKEIVLQSLDFEHFTHKDLASDVWKSGFYPIDVIMKRMEELYDSMDRAHQVDDDLLTTVSDINNRRSLRSLTYNVNSTQCWPPKP